MATQYKKSSLYKQTNLNSKYLDIYVPPLNSYDLTKMNKKIIEPKYDMRPDLLSYDLYGDASYWWIFAILNRSVIKDPLFDFKSGIEIYVPKTLLQVGL